MGGKPRKQPEDRLGRLTPEARSAVVDCVEAMLEDLDDTLDELDEEQIHLLNDDDSDYATFHWGIGYVHACADAVGLELAQFVLLVSEEYGLWEEQKCKAAKRKK